MHGDVKRFTHSLGFFLGPGLPRGLGVPVPSGNGVDLLTPFVVAVFFLDAPPGDGTSCIGAGVDVASELFSCDAAGLSLGMSSMVGAGEDAVDGESFLGRNLFSTVGGRASTTTLVCFFDDLSVRLVVSDVVDMVTVVVDMDE